jgi:hypothetical protein
MNIHSHRDAAFESFIVSMFLIHLCFKFQSVSIALALCILRLFGSFKAFLVFDF